MPFPLFGMIGGMLATRAGHAALSGSAVKTFLKGPVIQGGQFGVGYTGGSYLGYGVSNTGDPLGIHKPKYSSKRQNLGLPYGGYSYGRYGRGRYPRRRYRSRYGYSRRPYTSRRRYY
jgi:hypothetical protein